MMNNLPMNLISLIVVLMIPVFIALQIFLSLRKNKWAGIVIPAITLIVGVLIVTNTFSLIYPMYVGNADIGDEEDDYSVNCNIIVEGDDEEWQTSEVKAFRVYIEDKVTGEDFYANVEFDDKGKLIGGKKAMKYKKGLERCSNTCKLRGKSNSYDEMRKIYIDKYGDTYLGVKLIAIGIGFIPLLIYIIIYFLCRRHLKKKNVKTGIEKMQIDDL